MPAANYNIIIDQHQHFSRSFEVAIAGVPVDITGYTFEAQIRERIQSETAYNFTVTILDPSLGLIKMNMADTITATIKPGDYVYDLVMTDSVGSKTRLLQGQATVEGGTTR